MKPIRTLEDKKVDLQLKLKALLALKVITPLNQKSGWSVERPYEAQANSGNSLLLKVRQSLVISTPEEYGYILSISDTNSTAVYFIHPGVDNREESNEIKEGEYTVHFIDKDAKVNSRIKFKNNEQ